MEERDARDVQRRHAPMQPAPEAVIIDTSDLTLAQSIQAVGDNVVRLWSVRGQE
jgi:cytidylate kinase